MRDIEQGMLFRIPEMSATSFHAEKRLTIKQRCDLAVSLVFSDFRSKLAEIGNGDSACLGSQNMQPQGGSDTKTIHQNEIAERLKAEAQKKTPHTCESTTLQTLKSLPTQKSVGTETTPPEGQSTPVIQSMQPECAPSQTDAIQRQKEMVALSQHTGSPKMTMSECFQIRDALAQFVVQPTKIGAVKSCTSITATELERSGNSYAQAAIRLSARCETIQTGLDQLSNTWNAIKADPWLVFCETNEEQDFLEAAFGPMAFSVRGQDDPDEKERRILAWCDGERPVLISKTKIVGFGMNFQHCRNVLFASVNFSYEAFYQGVRRVWRFGQGRTVNVHVVLADTEAAIWSAIGVKSAKHDEMKRRMSEAMRGAQTQGARRVVYNRPLDLAFPSWIKGETK
jgi:hypothetical protein